MPVTDCDFPFKSCKCKLSCWHRGICSYNFFLVNCSKLYTKQQQIITENFCDLYYLASCSTTMKIPTRCKIIIYQVNFTDFCFTFLQFSINGRISALVMPRHIHISLFLFQQHFITLSVQNKKNGTDVTKANLYTPVGHKNTLLNIKCPMHLASSFKSANWFSALHHWALYEAF